jgi:uncharacterized protein involved in exopolysaccharide biosynthesis
MPKTSFADQITGWEKLTVTTDANKDELPFLTDMRSQLAAVVAGAKEASIRQDAFKAQVQQASRDLDEFKAKGKDLATRLRNGVRAQYGLKGEKLTEFGMKPRRKPQKAKPEPAAPPTPVPENSSGPKPNS